MNLSLLMDRRRIRFCSFDIYYSSFQNTEGVITIGRMSGCHIKFDDFSLSRRQCSVYSENDNWVLTDGDGEKLSTNGTWYYQAKNRLFVEEFFQLKDNMIFKAGQSLFAIKLVT